MVVRHNRVFLEPAASLPELTFKEATEPLGHSQRQVLHHERTDEITGALLALTVPQKCCIHQSLGEFVA